MPSPKSSSRIRPSGQRMAQDCGDFCGAHCDCGAPRTGVGRKSAASAATQPDMPEIGGWRFAHPPYARGSRSRPTAGGPPRVQRKTPAWFHRRAAPPRRCLARTLWGRRQASRGGVSEWGVLIVCRAGERRVTRQLSSIEQWRMTLRLSALVGMSTVGRPTRASKWGSLRPISCVGIA